MGKPVVTKWLQDHPYRCPADVTMFYRMLRVQNNALHVHPRRIIFAGPYTLAWFEAHFPEIVPYLSDQED